MEYELDSLGYVLHVYFGCNTDNSITYNGNVPDGYETLEEWAENEDIRAYRISEGNLVLDNARLQELESTYEQEHTDYRHVEHRELETLENAIKIINKTITYSTDTVEGNIVTTSNTKSSQPKITITNINPYAYSQIDLYVNGKNILPNTATTQTISGITFTQNEDRSITLDGTSTAAIEYNIAGSSTNTSPFLVFKKNEDYYLSGIKENLLNSSTNVDGYYINASGVITSYSGHNYTQLIPVSQTTYTFSGIHNNTGTNNKRIHGYDSEGNWVEQIDYFTITGSSSSTSYSRTFTINNTDIKYIRLSYFDDDTNVQLDLGSTAIDYEIYTGLNFNMYNYDGTDRTEVYSDTGGFITFTEDELVTQIVLEVASGETYDNFTFYPQLTYGIAEEDYETYKYRKCTIDFSEYIGEGLLASETIYPSETLYPYGTDINYISIEDTTVNISVDGEETVLGLLSLGLYDRFDTIYAIQDCYLNVTYYVNNLALEGTTTKNGNFSIDDEGNMSCNNAIINGSAIVNGGNFTVDKDGNMTCNNAVISGTLNNGNTYIYPSGLVKIQSAKSQPRLVISAYDDYTDFGGKIANSGIFYEDNQSNSSYTTTMEFELNGATHSSTNITSPLIDLRVVNNSTNYNKYVTQATPYSIATAEYNSSGSVSARTVILPSGITTPSVTQTSLKDSKKNFEKLEKALDIVNDTDIYKYNFKFEEDDDKKHIGFIIGDDFKYREEITSKENDGADIYSMVSVLWQAVKEQQDQIEELKKQLKGSDK